MLLARGGWGCDLFVLAVVACSHGSSPERPDAMERWDAEDTSTRTKGADSATLHIHALIVQGQLQEAEALLVQAVAAGLVARETATRMREQIAKSREQQNPAPARPPSSGDSEDVEIEEPQQRTCLTEMPGYPVCRELPEEYSFHSPRQALEAMKLKLGEKTLALHKQERTTEGPCPEIGAHYNVRTNGRRAGSITCCPCCVEATDGPIEWTKCRIVW